VTTLTAADSWIKYKTALFQFCSIRQFLRNFLITFSKL
jgi:hypothetical protein